MPEAAKTTLTDYWDLLVESDGTYRPGRVASDAWDQDFHIFSVTREATT
jgi:hypothetical protein